MLFRKLFRNIIREGTLTVHLADGDRLVFGDGGPPSAGVRLHSRSIDWLMALNPPLRVAEAYVKGLLTLDGGTLHDFLDVIARNYSRIETHPVSRVATLLRRHSRWLKQYNPLRRARRNVAHHYDLSSHLYDLFLDRDRQYSCAYFANDNVSLEQAQVAKKRLIARKLLLDHPDLRVLDIGSGWGGLALSLAREADCRITGVTLSQEQFDVSRRRAADTGLAGRIDFRLQDYRTLQGRFDRIVSVGMFEHVGARHYDEFFAKVRDLLDDDGVCLIHTIGRSTPPAPINPFIRKYIFPGADLPSLSEMMAAIERAGLVATDVDIWRLHYAKTLRHWFDRFQANRQQVAELYDERFCRMWELYLAGCEQGFRHQGLVVFQVQLARHQEAVPLTRDYLFEPLSRLAPADEDRARAY